MNEKTFNSCEPIWEQEGLSTEDCKEKCLNKKTCTAFNHIKRAESQTNCKSSNGPCSQCKLQNCSLPIVVPTGEYMPGYKGYYQTGRHCFERKANSLFLLSATLIDCKIVVTTTETTTESHSNIAADPGIRPQ